ncbi:uncharacterized protein LOC115713624 [Cannabis sativa]|uniref:uncharacterized protein LOC115713624 n=1 Tax=Cannabis sativa TaxID=3483 RepID=UPI0029CA7C54|nr:uncharacterized protein LOC115713624 [Cannabis sativa]
MHIDRKQWDLEVLHDLFEARDIGLIMQVPLSDHVNVDSWFWSKEPIELKGERGLQLEPELWRALWKVKVPPKVLHLAWKAISGCLPTRSQLRTKHVPVDPRCVFCNSDEETIVHVLGRVALVDELLMVAWGIWKARNEFLWQGRSSQAVNVVRMARSTLYNWLLAQKSRFEPLLFDDVVASSSVCWEKPPAGMLKINTNGAIFAATTQYGTGMVIRDSHGKLIEASSSLYPRVCQPAVAEALSVKEALCWLKRRNLSNVLSRQTALLLFKLLIARLHFHLFLAAHCVACGAYFWSDRLFTESNVPSAFQFIVIADIAI